MRIETLLLRAIGAKRRVALSPSLSPASCRLPPQPNATVKRLLILTGRALTLRCPNCGGGGGRSLFRSWWSTKPNCPYCGFALDRGEPDFWIGGYAVNLVAAELFVTAILIAVTIATWPVIPWTFLQWGGATLAVVVPLLFFPVSRLLWLAWDFFFRPVRD